MVPVADVGGSSVDAVADAYHPSQPAPPQVEIKDPPFQPQAPVHTYDWFPRRSQPAPYVSYSFGGGGGGGGAALGSLQAAGQQGQQRQGDGGGGGGLPERGRGRALV